jgi:hypothetical protein
MPGVRSCSIRNPGYSIRRPLSQHRFKAFKVSHISLSDVFIFVISVITVKAERSGSAARESKRVRVQPMLDTMIRFIFTILKITTQEPPNCDSDGQREENK